MVPCIALLLMDNDFDIFLGGELEWGNSIKRPFIQLPDIGAANLSYASLPNVWSEQLVKALIRPESMSYPSMLASCPPPSILQETKAKVEAAMVHKAHILSLKNVSVQSYHLQQPNQHVVAKWEICQGWNKLARQISLQ